jgi:hypothetical protein
MGMLFRVYLGPFAEWLVPQKGCRKAWERAQAIADRFRVGERGGLNFDPNCFEIVKVGNNRFLRGCWTAYFPPGAAVPPRPFHWSSPPEANEQGIVEFSGFDVKQEKRWFRETFAEQLKELAEVFGGEPTIKWGVVTTLS